MSTDAQYTEGCFGWVEDRPGFTAYAATLEAGDDFWDTLRAADDGGDRFWYRALAMCLRDLGLKRWLRDRDGVPCIRSYNQADIGSCVGNGEAKRQSYVAALDKWLHLEPEEFVGMFSPEWAYYASREQSGMLGRGDGSTGYGAARANVVHGALIQGVYGDVDLSEYTVSNCYRFGLGRGIPQAAVTEAGKHKYGRYIQVDTAEKVWLCAGAGIPINFCSGQGFQGSRDEDGFIRARGTWYHSMCGCAARRTTKRGRKGILIDQSWGDDWTGGPYYGDMPWGAFYADLEVAGEMASQGDTFADIGYIGHQAELPLSFTRI
jgi:hypothetical protein